MARDAPTRVRTASTCASMMEVIVHVGAQPQASNRESLQHLLATGGVGHLGVELHSEDAGLSLLEHRDRSVGGGSGGDEPGRDLDDGVEVAHPHRELRRLLVQQETVTRPGQCGSAVLAPTGVNDGATQLQGHELRAVADTQDGDAQFVDGQVEQRGTLHVDRLGAAAEDDPRRVVLGDLGRGDGVRDDLAVHPGLANPPRDQLGVLGAEVDDENGVGGTGTRRWIVVRGRDGGGADALAHPHALGPLEVLPLGLERRGDHDLGLLEGRERLVAAGRHARAQGAEQVRAARRSLGAGPSRISSSVLRVPTYAEAPRGSVGWKVATPPAGCPVRGRFGSGGQRRSDHDGVGAADDGIGDVAGQCPSRRRR